MERLMERELLQDKLQRDRLYDMYRRLLTDKQIEIMDQYCYDDLTAVEIADNLGISRQAVHDTIKKSEQVISEWESRLGFFDFTHRHDLFLEKLILHGERRKDSELLELIDRHTKEVFTVGGNVRK